MSESVKSFLSGWAGGLGILAVGHPFDTVKTVMQNSAKGQYKSSLECAKTIIAKEGPLGLYKGVQAPMAGIGTVFAIYFVTYDTCERVLRRTTGKDAAVALSMPEVIVCGGSTGIFGSFILGPAELIKVRQQTAIQNGTDGSLMAVIKQGSLTRGLGATMMRDVPGSMAWFGAYELTKKTLCDDPKKPTVVQALVAGGMGGLGMWSFAIPLDAIKTKVQASSTPMSFLQGARLIHGELGFGGFYRGIGPALLRAFPANAACFASKETTQSFLDKCF
uniref:Mitochondrial carrier protein n=1 Tax=Neobodo designis TaxID=312471 RepID=A0A7S1M1C3_NEODS|mmetsp:Transcript_32433/g.100329  ORF Transcript_32433/g.100329 Transcript_32433/m.100329 type:complete len:276 (+) Transcript_32433:38-865(+)